jgi:hypothetical protein
MVSRAAQIAHAGRDACRGPIILSPLNSPVKMSPHEQGDIRREPERVTTSGGYFCMYQGEVACARAAELPCLSVRQIKRLRIRMREDGEAACLKLLSVSVSGFERQS